MPSENDEKTETLHNSRLHQQEIGQMEDECQLKRMSQLLEGRPKLSPLVCTEQGTQHLWGEWSKDSGRRVESAGLPDPVPRPLAPIYPVSTMHLTVLYPASTRSPSRPSLALRRQPQRLLSADFNLSLNMNCYRLTGQNKSINLEVPYSTKTLSALSLSYYTWSFSFFLHQQNMRRENFTP